MKLTVSRWPYQLVQAIKIAYDARTVNAANIEYLQTLQMLLALALWHEITHGFVSFIAGVTISRTPPACMPNFLKKTINPDDLATAVGESGDFMECEIWGGSMQITEFPSNDPANMTVRLPLLIPVHPAIKILRGLIYYHVLTFP